MILLSIVTTSFSSLAVVGARALALSTLKWEEGLVLILIIYASL